MKHDPLFEFFHTTSRIFIVIPIFILVIGLFIRFNQNLQKSQIYRDPKKILLSITPALTNKATKLANTEINLKGPFVCQFSSKEATVSGYIKNTKIYGSVEKQSGTTNVLLSDDCFYTWSNASSLGEKICGLKSYISMIGNLPLANLLGNNTAIPIKTDTIVSILNSCKKEDIKNEKVFDIPKNVLFNESKTKMPRL